MADSMVMMCTVWDKQVLSSFLNRHQLFIILAFPKKLFSLLLSFYTLILFWFSCRYRGRWLSCLSTFDLLQRVISVPVQSTDITGSTSSAILRGHMLAENFLNFHATYGNIKMSIAGMWRELNKMTCFCMGCLLPWMTLTSKLDLDLGSFVAKVMWGLWTGCVYKAGLAVDF